jgi:hypothetical protein
MPNPVAAAPTRKLAVGVVPGDWRDASAAHVRGPEDDHRRVEQSRPHPHVDLSIGQQPVVTLELEDGTAGQRTEDPVHGQARERKHLVQSSLQRRHERTVAAQLKHHPGAPRAG